MAALILHHELTQRVAMSSLCGRCAAICVTLHNVVHPIAVAESIDSHLPGVDPTMGHQTLPNRVFLDVEHKSNDTIVRYFKFGLCCTRFASGGGCEYGRLQSSGPPCDSGLFRVDYALVVYSFWGLFWQVVRRAKTPSWCGGFSSAILCLYALLHYWSKSGAAGLSLA